MNASSQRIRNTGQLVLIDEPEPEVRLDASLWHGSFNGRESTLQQLSPYVGKLKSGMVRVLLHLYSQHGDTVLDPFSGSGVVPLEALLAGRTAIANDLSPYAYTLTRGKLEAPESLTMAVERAAAFVNEVEERAPSIDPETIDPWVRGFFHPETMKEVMAAFLILRETKDNFLTACLMGILQHVRPGFLSYPASHLVPYLRVKKLPQEEYPEMYTYRDLRSRLIAKVKRAYRRPMLPENWELRKYEVHNTNSMNLPVTSDSVHAIISSPPYFGALDYARDNRLRLWFLGCTDWKQLDNSLTANRKVYLPQMSECLKEMDRVLKPGGYCVLVLGDVERDGEYRHTAEILSDLAGESTGGRFVTETIYDDLIPDERRTRRRTKTTKFERILVMRKH